MKAESLTIKEEHWERRRRHEKERRKMIRLLKQAHVMLARLEKVAVFTNPELVTLEKIEKFFKTELIKD
jgi:hypothetical protein